MGPISWPGSGNGGFRPAVIVSKWKSYADVVMDNITGFCYEFGNNEEFKKVLCNVIDAPRENPASCKY